MNKQHTVGLSLPQPYYAPEIRGYFRMRRDLHRLAKHGEPGAAGALRAVRSELHKLGFRPAA